MVSKQSLQLLHSGVESRNSGDATAAELPPNGVDWTSADTVAAHVSKTTLAGMQQLWRTHAAQMDSRGREFAERVYSLHSHAIQDIAELKTLELKQVLAVLNRFTASTRETVLQIFQDMRLADDEFAQGLYQTSRRAFTRNLQQALEAKDQLSAQKIQHLKAQHEQVLAAQRRAAAVETQQAISEQREVLMREMKQDNKRSLLQAISAITAMAQQGQLSLGPSLPPTPSLPGPSPSTAHTGGHTQPWSSGAAVTMAERPGAGSQEGAWPSTHTGPLDSSGAPATSSRPSTAPGPPVQASRSAAALSLELLQALAQQSDGELGSVLAQKELQANLEATTAALEEMRGRVEELTMSLQQEKADIANWKDKWAQENQKTDGIKRECLQPRQQANAAAAAAAAPDDAAAVHPARLLVSRLDLTYLVPPHSLGDRACHPSPPHLTQVIIKCEQRVQALQAQHMSELSKRDHIMQRCKNTIVRLEARVAELSGQPADPRMVSYDTPGRAGTTTTTTTTSNTAAAQPQQQQQQQHHGPPHPSSSFGGKSVFGEPSTGSTGGG
ncbi:hypothetical protein QJQ45_000807 [Haematococcus lacustris]|nr:hypothetical protein QJQ45_000807 [Haematococcus lacustris]